jgi:hypothetical protein
LLCCVLVLEGSGADRQLTAFPSSQDGVTWHLHRVAWWEDTGDPERSPSDENAAQLLLGVGGQGGGSVDIRGFWLGL